MESVMNNIFEGLFSKLSELKIIQKEGEWSECIPDDIWEKYFDGNFKIVASNLLIEKCRWFETSIDVIKIFDNLLGIRYISNVFSEGSSVEDCSFSICFYKMEEFTTVSYRQVK
jgi:hypothetical protein